MKNILLIFCTSCLVYKANAQDTIRISDIQSAVIKNNPVFKMLDAEARSMKEAANGAYSWMAPELGIGLFQTPYNPAKWKSMDGQPGMGSVMISAQQMLPNRKRQQADYAFMNAQGSLETQQKDIALNELLYTARKNYYDWIVLERKLRVLAENDRLLKFMMESAGIRYKNGLGKIGAYYKVTAALANTESMTLMLQNEIAQKRITINTIMNRNTNLEFLVDTNIVWIEFNKAMFQDSVLYKQRSDIKLLDKTIEVNRLERNAELAKLKPEFGIQYNHMTGWSQQPMMATIMAMVKLPLAKWSSRMNKAKAESIVWRNAALVNQQQMIINEAAGMANAAFTEWGIKQKQLRLYEQQIMPALRKNFQTMQMGYEQNTEELFELFDAWEALNMTQMDYLDLLQKALQSQAELIKITEFK
jgi:outer membrane protein TolC